MNSILIALVVFLCCFGGIRLGLYVRLKTPEHHFSEEARDIVIASASFLATLTALILGLLVGSASTTFQSFYQSLEDMGVEIMIMDQAMAYYGPETKEIREAFHQNIITIVRAYWPEDIPKLASQGITVKADHPLIHRNTKSGKLSASIAMMSAEMLATIQNQLIKLKPKDDAQRWWQSKALQAGDKLTQERWLIDEQAKSTLPASFLVVMAVWLIILFGSFSLFSPLYKTVHLILDFCAISVASSLFLILELNKPASGLLQASSEPLLRVILLISQ